MKCDVGMQLMIISIINVSFVDRLFKGNIFQMYIFLTI